MASNHNKIDCFDPQENKIGGLVKDQFNARIRDQLFMAIDAKVYFPNLVAENLDLKPKTSLQTLERILNFEKAFVGEKSPAKPSDVQAVGVGSSSFKDQKKDNCRHCGYPYRT